MKEVKTQKKLKKKLSLNKKTITNLNELGMSKIKGGVGRPSAKSMWFTCAVPGAAC